MHARNLIAFGVVVVSCAARTELDVRGTMDGGFACTSPSGVRICGGPCPAVTDCPGRGCTGAFAVDGTQSDVGVCWADTSETDYRCDACQASDACLQQAPGLWVCVPDDVCETLWNLGFDDVCRYADKTRYDDEPLPTATSGCPAPSHVHFEYRACGGDCAPCPLNGRCDGVSPVHPFGLCNDGLAGYTGFDPGVSCGSTPMCEGIEVCAVLDVPAADLDVARQYGICMDEKNCLDFASRFPGGLGCYDAEGTRLN